MIISVPAQTAVWMYRRDGTFAPILVGTQVSAEGLYRPPVFSQPQEPCPPQTIISLPVQTAVCPVRGSAAPYFSGIQVLLVQPSTTTATGPYNAEGGSIRSDKSWRALLHHLSKRVLRHVTRAVVMVSLATA